MSGITIKPLIDHRCLICVVANREIPMANYVLTPALPQPIDENHRSLSAAFGVFDGEAGFPAEALRRSSDQGWDRGLSGSFSIILSWRIAEENSKDFVGFTLNPTMAVCPLKRTFITLRIAERRTRYDLLIANHKAATRTSVPYRASIPSCPPMKGPDASRSFVTGSISLSYRKLSKIRTYRFAYESKFRYRSMWVVIGFQFK